LMSVGTFKCPTDDVCAGPEDAPGRSFFPGRSPDRGLGRAGRTTQGTGTGHQRQSVPCAGNLSLGRIAFPGRTAEPDAVGTIVQPVLLDSTEIVLTLVKILFEVMLSGGVGLLR